MPIRTRRFSVSQHVNYQYGAKLGQGSFGEVWEVFTPSAAPYSREEHPVAAMKIIRSPHDDSWNEVELLKKIEHPHIAKYLTSFQNTEGSLCIIKGYCDGGPFVFLLYHFVASVLLVETFFTNGVFGPNGKNLWWLFEITFHIQRLICC